MAIASIPVALSGIGYIYFLWTNPDYLRSEEFQIKKESIGLLGDKDNRLNADADDVLAMNTTNPRQSKPENRKVITISKVKRLPPPNKKKHD